MNNTKLNVRMLAKELEEAFKSYFKDTGQNNIVIIRKWNPFKDRLESKRYAVKVDLVIEPWGDSKRGQTTQSRQIFNKNDILVKELERYHHQNCEEIGIRDDKKDYEKKNTRCFIAMEIERTGSKKHRLADIFNSSNLGYVAVIVAWDKKVIKSYLGVLNYFKNICKLQRDDFRNNILIITKDQLNEALL